jgi:serine/threonine protein kinase
MPSENSSRSEPGAAFAHALTSRRGPTGLPGSLDVAYDRLMLELRLFKPTAESPRQYIYIKEFCIERRIGSGGMGSVYLAWSFSLKRRVAVKILFDFDGPQNGAIALQEAHCLARVNHANIVHVYEVDGAAPWCIATPKARATTPYAGEAAMIAMEYVDGSSLETWLATTRTWRTIVDKFVQAARGLAAAHRAGLLHSDVTPRNILVRTDVPESTVKLVDFGLSRSDGDPASDSQPYAASPPDPLSSDNSHSTASDGKKQPPRWAPELVVDMVCGTPGYSAPEQLQLGNTIDARSDVFGLCASMWYALATQLPYDPAVLRPGTTVEARIPLSIRRATWPRHLPRWLCEVLVGGLDIEPGRRPDSMDRLLEIIERRLARPQRFLRWVVVPLASALACLAIVAALLHQPVPEPFGRHDAGIETVWHADRQAALATAVGAHSELRSSWPELRHAIGEYAAGWERIRATIVASSEWTGDAKRFAGRCLLDARDEFDQILRSIVDAAAAPPQGGRAGSNLLVHRWIVGLRPPTVCRIPRYATATIATRGATTSGDDAWRDPYARGYQHYLAGRLDDASTAFTTALQLARNDPGGRARVQFRLGLVDLARSRADAAITHFHDALRLTADGSDPYLKLHTLTNLMIATADPIAGLGYYADARGILADTFAEDPAAVHEEAGNLHVRAAWAVGRAADTRRFKRCPIDCDDVKKPTASCEDTDGPTGQLAFQCALDLLDLAADGPCSSDLRALVVKTRTEALFKHGDLAEAEKVAQAAVALDDPDHPEKWSPLLYWTLGRVQLSREPTADGEVTLGRALKAHVAQGTADRASALDVLLLLSALADQRGDSIVARDLGERARAILEGQDIREHIPDAVQLFGRLGSLYLSAPVTRDAPLGIERLRRGLELAAGADLDETHTAIVLQMHGLLAHELLRGRRFAEAEDTLTAGMARENGRFPEERCELALLAVELAVQQEKFADASDRLARVTTLLSTLRQPGDLLEPWRDWLDARVRGPADRQARRLAENVLRRVDADPDLAAPFLDPTVIRTWLNPPPKRENQ